MIIREMILSDLDQIMILEKNCFKVPWSRESFEAEIVKNELAHYIVLEIDSQIVGYGGVWYVMDEGHITNVAIDSNYRKQGLGKKIVAEMIEKAKLSKMNHMTLEVRRSNSPAISLYERMGFEILGTRPKYYTDNNEDALIMWLKLNER